jgi:hypothetical protein
MLRLTGLAAVALLLFALSVTNATAADLPTKMSLALSHDKVPHGKKTDIEFFASVYPANDSGKLPRPVRIDFWIKRPNADQWEKIGYSTVTGAHLNRASLTRSTEELGLVPGTYDFRASLDTNGVGEPNIIGSTSPVAKLVMTPKQAS